MCDEKFINAHDLEKLLSVLEHHFSEVNRRLDRIEQVICERTSGTGQSKRADVRRWTSSVATKVGIKLLRTLAKEAAPKNGRQRQRLSARHKWRLIDISRSTFRISRDVQN